LTDAVLINPYGVDEFAEAIRQAIEMPEEERQARMQRLRRVVAQNNIYKWAGSIVSEMANLAT
jgi:trehalose 6-phosphate synthase